VRLRELIEGVDVIESTASDEIEITAITADSRQVTGGSLFVAVPGFVQDGASFIRAALGKGAAAIVTEAAPEDGFSFVRVLDARAALALIAANFHGHPARQLTLIGVTGTSGKTTTTKMVEAIIEETGTPVGLIGTIEYRAGDERSVADRTTPDSIVLQEWFARMVLAGVKYGVMEVSSHALALRRTHGVVFSAAVFTNLSREHFEFHRDFEDYYSAKRILFHQVERSRRRALVNIDDSYGRRLASELGRTAISFGLGAEAEIRPEEGFAIDIDGLRGTVTTPFGPVRIASPLLGVPNLYNWMGAIGAALVAGIDVPVVERGIERLRSVKGRFERVRSDGGVVLVDYAHKPDALEKLLRAVRGLAPDRRITVVFGCGGDRDEGKRPLMGQIAGTLADMTILTSDNPRTEPPEKIIDQIEQGIATVEGARYQRIADRRKAIELAVESAGEDEVVVIAGKGHENYQVLGDQIVHFDDREEAEFALSKRARKS
jgi:UDP-N-acetylmuramoyl-L-alanyl-D-glutamate--2,6-diaminopimelate ligase